MNNIKTFSEYINESINLPMTEAVKPSEIIEPEFIDKGILSSITSGEGVKQDGFTKLSDIISNRLFIKIGTPKSAISDVFVYKLPLKETTGKTATFRILSDVEKAKVSEILGVELPSNRVIELSSKADEKTILHELAHVLRDNKKRGFDKKDIERFESSADRLMKLIDKPQPVGDKVTEVSTTNTKPDGKTNIK